MSAVRTLALDLEGTLISNAVSQFPRPGLHDFLEWCGAKFPRVVVYTGVSERRFRLVAAQLIADGEAPRWFGNVQHVYWGGEFKDLRSIPGALPETSLLVDDLAEAIMPEQRDRWVAILPFDRPYPTSDRELERVVTVLAQYVQ